MTDASVVALSHQCSLVAEHQWPTFTRRAKHWLDKLDSEVKLHLALQEARESIETVDRLFADDDLSHTASDATLAAGAAGKKEAVEAFVTAARRYIHHKKATVGSGWDFSAGSTDEDELAFDPSDDQTPGLSSPHPDEEAAEESAETRSGGCDAEAKSEAAAGCGKRKAPEADGAAVERDEAAADVRAESPDAGSPSGSSPKRARSQKHACVACYENKPQVVIVPCGHMCLCIGCAKTIGKHNPRERCPLCRKSVSRVLRVYQP